MVWLVEDLLAAISTFQTVAATDPVSALLLVVAGLVLGVTVGVVGLLGLGAISNLVVGWP